MIEDPIEAAKLIAPSGVDQSTRERGRSRSLRSAGLPFAVTLASLVLMLGGWALAALLINDQNTLPTPGTVVSRFFDLLSKGPGGPTLTTNILTSLRRILLGWGIGVIGGVAIGTAMAVNRWLRLLIEPVVEIARPIPPLALIPLLIIWFGIGESPKIIILVFATLPVVLIATVSAIRGVDQNWDRAAQTLGASRWQRVWRVTVRGALPEILVGIRIGQGLAWGTLIAAEIIASTAGLGYMILQAGTYLDTPTVFVGVIVIGLLAYLIDRLLRVAEHVLVPWKGHGG